MDENKSTREIARILSDESGHKITQSSVHRYFASFRLEKQRAVEKRGQLVAKIAEAEISTIEQRQAVINGLLEIAENGYNEHARVNAYRAANNALDSLDARLGNLSPSKNTQNNFFVNATGAEPVNLRERMKVYDAIFEEAE